MRSWWESVNNPSEFTPEPPCQQRANQKKQSQAYDNFWLRQYLSILHKNKTVSSLMKTWCFHMEAHLYQRQFTNASCCQVLDSNYTEPALSLILVLELRNCNFYFPGYLMKSKLHFLGTGGGAVAHHSEEHTSIDLWGKKFLSGKLNWQNLNASDLRGKYKCLYICKTWCSWPRTG